MIRNGRGLFALLLVLALLAPVLGARAGTVLGATAVAAIDLTPNAVVAGLTSTILVHGSGFTPDGQVSVRYDTTTPIGAATADATGVFTATATITSTLVLDKAIGPHHVQATGAGARSATAVLAVVGVHFSTPQAPPGAQVTISGQGFLANQPLLVRLGDHTVLTSKTTANGAFVNKTFLVPSALSGPQTLLVENVPSPAKGAPLVAAMPFTVSHATLIIQPTAIDAGQAVAVSGTGYAEAGKLAIKLGSSTLATVTTDGSGAFGPAQITVPVTTGSGPQPLTASDAGGQTLAGATLTVRGVQAALVVTPATGVAGARVRLAGSGFHPDERVVIVIGGHFFGSARADHQGRFTLQITLPRRLAAGAVLLQATGQASHAAASASYTIPQATVTVSPPGGNAGTKVTVTGHAFAVDEAITILVDGVRAGRIHADAHGTFMTTITLPAGHAGPVVVRAIGESSQVAAQTSVIRAETILPSPTPTSTPTASSTATHTATPTLIATRTTTATRTPTLAPSVTHTPTPSATRTRTATRTATRTPTVSATRTPTAMPTATRPPTATATPVPPLVAVSPGSVTAGGAVTVSGARYQPGEQIDVQLTTATGLGALHLTYAFANASGIFNLSGVTIPSVTPAGSYRIAAIGLRTGHRALAALLVTAPRATLGVRPASFAPEDDIQVSGTNFLPGEQVSIVLSTTSGTAAVILGQVRANGVGAFGPAKLHVPFGVPAGALHLVASGQRSNRQAAVTVTVRTQAPTLIGSATRVKPNDLLVLTGSHFQPGETVTLDLVALSSSTRLATVQVNSAGGFTTPRIRIPQNTPEGTISLVATGGSSHLSAVLRLAVGALPASLHPNVGRVTAGHPLSLSGAGFIPGETIIVQLTGTRLPRLTLASAVVGVNGAISIANVVIPPYVPAGAYSLVIFGQTSGRSATSNLTVQAPPPAAPILSIIGAGGNPIKLSPGSLVQLAGSNFPGGAGIAVELVGSSSRVLLGVVRANANGALGPVGLTVPANTHAGAYSIQALIASRSVASVAVLVAPLAPTLVVSPGVVSPNTIVTVRGSGFASGEQVVLALNGAALATTPATVLTGAGGTFVVTFSVPATVHDGANILTAVGAASRAGSSATLRASLPIATQWYFPHGDTTGDHRTVIGLLNPSDVAANVTMTFLYQAAPERSVTQMVPAHAQTNVDLALVAGAGRYISTIVSADRQIGAQSTIYYGVGDSSVAPGARAPATAWYLAEGYTGGSFQEYLSIMNPNARYASVDVRFLPFNGLPPRETRFSIGPRSTIRLDVGQYMRNQSVSTIVTADMGVVVERDMRFGLGQRGAHDKIGVPTASTVWLFAQGQTGPERQTFLSILNPNQAAPAAVTATFFDSRGFPAGSKTIVIDPLRRGNIKINDTLPNADVGVVVTSNVPVVAERPQYEGPANLGLAVSGSDVFGRNGGGTSWIFAGGDTANANQDRIDLFNPGLQPVRITATFYTNTGLIRTQSLTIGANSRGAIAVNAVPGLPPGPYGVVLGSTNGQVFVAEQSSLNQSLGQSDSSQGSTP